MDVSSISHGIQANLAGAKGVNFEMGVRTLEKSNELIEQQGEAMIEMIEESVVDASSGRIDARA